MMENLEEIGVLIIVNDEIPIVKDSLDFGIHFALHLMWLKSLLTLYILETP